MYVDEYDEVPLPEEPTDFEYDHDEIPDADTRSLNGVSLDDLPNPDSRALEYAFTGVEFLFGSRQQSTPVWGLGSESLWQSGEALMIAADVGIGKTTIAGQLVEARLGISESFLGLPVVPGKGKVLYLACDRPLQISRSFRRLWGRDLETTDPATVHALHEKLVVWKGPLARNLLKKPDHLAQLVEFYGADTLVIDSVKDVLPQLNTDEAGSAFNNAVQQVLRNGCEVLVLHHNRKQGNESKGSKVRHLDQVYGSMLLTAGLGTVIALEGERGNPEIHLNVLKGAADYVDMDLLTDFRRGRHDRVNKFDPLKWLFGKSDDGCTAKELAARQNAVLDPSREQVEQARRWLETQVGAGRARKEAGRRGGAPGANASHYFASGAFGEEVF